MHVIGPAVVMIGMTYVWKFFTARLEEYLRRMSRRIGCDFRMADDGFPQRREIKRHFRGRILR